MRDPLVVQRGPASDDRRKLEAVVPENVVSGGSVVFKTPDSLHIRVPVTADVVPGSTVLLDWPEKPSCCECCRPRCVSPRRCRQCCSGIGWALLLAGAVLWGFLIVETIEIMVTLEHEASSGTGEHTSDLLYDAIEQAVQRMISGCFEGIWDDMVTDASGTGAKIVGGFFAVIFGSVFCVVFAIFAIIVMLALLIAVVVFGISCCIVGCGMCYSSRDNDRQDCVRWFSCCDCCCFRKRSDRTKAVAISVEAPRTAAGGALLQPQEQAYGGVRGSVQAQVPGVKRA